MDDIERLGAAWTQQRSIDVAQYYRMAEARMFPEYARLELIDGEIREMAPIGGRHVGAIMALNELFMAALLVPAHLGRFRVSIQGPLRLDDRSEPEPDVVLLRHRPDRYRSKQPPLGTDAVLVVEVAESSLVYDTNVKMPLYARHGIAEYWIVDLDTASVMVCRSPDHDEYRDKKSYAGFAHIAPLALPGVFLQVADIVTN